MTRDVTLLTASSGLSTATALTQLVAAPGPSLRIYVVHWHCSGSMASTTTADQQFTLKTGDGTYLDGCFTPANGGAAIGDGAAPVIALPVNKSLCWINAAVGSKIVTVTYYVGS